MSKADPERFRAALLLLDTEKVARDRAASEKQRLAALEVRRRAAEPVVPDVQCPKCDVDKGPCQSELGEVMTGYHESRWSVTIARLD